MKTHTGTWHGSTRWVTSYRGHGTSYLDCITKDVLRLYYSLDGIQVQVGGVFISLQ